jgi:hypothetical protein
VSEWPVLLGFCRARFGVFSQRSVLVRVRQVQQTQEHFGMGWKNVKEQYGIGHMVAVYPEKGICVGSPYCHDLIIIADADRKLDYGDTVYKRCVDIGHGLVIWRGESLGRGEPFDGWVRRWTEDPAELRRLIDAPDTFEKSIVVYTYDYDGNIIEKLCEAPGWPNVTHDGCMMYENNFSTDRDQVIAWAKRELSAASELAAERVQREEQELADARQRLAKYEAAKARIESA